MAATKETKAIEKETVFLPIVSGEPNCVTFGLNGKLWQIPRGQHVDVPKEIAEIVYASEAAKMYAMQRSDEESAKASKEVALS